MTITHQMCECSQGDTCPQGRIASAARCKIVRTVKNGGDLLEPGERKRVDELRNRYRANNSYEQAISLLMGIVDRLAPRPRSNEERLRFAMKAILNRADVPVTLRGYIIGELNATKPDNE